MLIDFSKIEEKVIPKFKNGNNNYLVRSIALDETKIMRGTLKPDCSIGCHPHVNNSELIYVIEGKLSIICDGKLEEVTPGCIHLCPKGHTHEIKNVDKDDAMFLAIVF